MGEEPHSFDGIDPANKLNWGALGLCFLFAGPTSELALCLASDCFIWEVGDEKHCFHNGLSLLMPKKALEIAKAKQNNKENDRKGKCLAVFPLVDCCV